MASYRHAVSLTQAQQLAAGIGRHCAAAVDFVTQAELMDAGNTRSHAGIPHFNTVRLGAGFKKTSGTQTAKHLLSFGCIAAGWSEADIEVAFNIFPIKRTHIPSVDIKAGQHAPVASASGPPVAQLAGFPAR